jgi:hypothetical protein
VQACEEVDDGVQHPAAAAGVGRKLSVAVQREHRRRRRGGGGGGGGDGGGRRGCGEPLLVSAVEGLEVGEGDGCLLGPLPLL